MICASDPAILSHSNVMDQMCSGETASKPSCKSPWMSRGIQQIADFPHGASVLTVHSGWSTKSPLCLNIGASHIHLVLRCVMTVFDWLQIFQSVNRPAAIGWMSCYRTPQPQSAPCTGSCQYSKEQRFFKKVPLNSPLSCPERFLKCWLE